MDENEDALGSLQVAQLHLAKLLETGSRWQTILGELLHGLGQQDLTASRHAKQTRQTVEWSGEIVSSARFGLAGVDGHARAQRSELVGPGLRQKGALRRQRSAESGWSRGKGGLRSIADCLEEDSAVCTGRFPQQRDVSRHGRHHGGPVTLPERTAVFYVGEEKRDGATWQLGHRQSPRFSAMVR
jgi:hypothetical protein